jgi:hypothetical protein
MSHIRGFSHTNIPITRNVDDDAPLGMRHELADLFFHLFRRIMGRTDEEDFYQIISQSLGRVPERRPLGGFRLAASELIEEAEWPRVYDLITRIWLEFRYNPDVQEDYRDAVNRILSGNHVVWELDNQGHFHRVLPEEVENQIDAAVQELSEARFASALHLLDEAMNAYNDIPRRDRDACANAFDAMEAVAKIVYQKPTDTFSRDIEHIRRNNLLDSGIVRTVETINRLRNGNFGHGMTTPFTLTGAEVDFIYLSCISGILLFSRTQKF